MDNIDVVVSKAGLLRVIEHAVKGETYLMLRAAETFTGDGFDNFGYELSNCAGDLVDAASKAGYLEVDWAPALDIVHAYSGGEA